MALMLHLCIWSRTHTRLAIIYSYCALRRINRWAMSIADMIMVFGESL